MNARRNRRRGISLLAGAVIGLGCVARTEAATNTWTNTLTNSFWDQFSNWSLNNIPNSGDAVVFPTPGPTGKTVLLPNSGTMAAQSLTFNESYTLNSGQLTLSGTNGPISIASGKTATINSVLGSNSGLTVSGGGTLVLNGNNQTALSSGDMHINAGTVRISTDANLGAQFKTWTNGALEVDGTFTTTRRFEPSNGIIRITAGNTLTLAANDQLGFSSTDTWTKEGDGTLKVTGQSSRFGVTFLNAGTTRIEGTSGFPQLGYGPLYVGAATLELAGTNASSFSTIRVQTASVLRGIGSSVTANNVVAAAGGDIFPTLAAGSGVVPFDVFTVQMNSTFGGTINSTITIAGPGTVKLTQNNNYPGAWNVSSGKLRVSALNGLGTGSGQVSVASGAALILDNHFTNRTINLASGGSLQGMGTSSATGTINVAAGSSTSLWTYNSGDVLNIGPGLSGNSSATLLINSAGVVALTAPSPSYAGAWWVGFGTLRLSNAASLGTGTTPIRISGASGVLEGRSGVTIPRDITFEAGTIAGTSGGASYTGAITVANAANVTLSGTTTLGDGPNDLTGGGGGAVIHVAGAGITTLTQPSDVSANWIIDNSVLSISDDAQLGAAGNTVTLNHNAGQFRTTATINSTRNLVFNAGTFDSGIYDSTFGQVSGGTGAMLKVGNGTLTIDRIRAATLTVAAGTIKLKPDGSNNATSTLKALSVVDATRFDLGDNKLIVRTTPAGSWDGSAYTDLTGRVASGRNGGGWDGFGVVTSMSDAALGGRTTIGVAMAADAGIALTATALWGGQTVSATDTLLMYTWGGDANLDGKLNIDDYTRIDSSIGLGLTGWANGDFNFDGKLNIDDYTILDSTIQIQGSAFPTAGVSAVPEPGMGMLILCFLLPRRRR